jgi:SNF2 family DNA or RNA helicase
VLIEQSDAAVAAAAAARHSPSNAQQQQQYQPALIVVPDADVAKWEAQLALYLPDVNTVSYTGCARSRELILQHELLHAADAAAVSTSATAPSRLKCHVLLTSHSVAESTRRCCAMYTGAN